MWSFASCGHVQVIKKTRRGKRAGRNQRERASLEIGRAGKDGALASSSGSARTSQDLTQVLTCSLAYLSSANVSMAKLKELHLFWCLVQQHARQMVSDMSLCFRPSKQMPLGGFVSRLWALLLS